MKLNSICAGLAIAIGIQLTHAASPCDGQQVYASGIYSPKAASVFSRSPLVSPFGFTGSLMGRTEFPNGILSVDWETPNVTNHLLLPMDYPWADAVAAGVIKAVEEGRPLQVVFCKDPTNSDTRVNLIDFVNFFK